LLFLFLFLFLLLEGKKKHLRIFYSNLDDNLEMSLGLFAGAVSNSVLTNDPCSVFLFGNQASTATSLTSVFLVAGVNYTLAISGSTPRSAGNFGIQVSNLQRQAMRWRVWKRFIKRELRGDEREIGRERRARERREERVRELTQLRYSLPAHTPWHQAGPLRTSLFRAFPPPPPLLGYHYLSLPRILTYS
jgi:hypothetical protein